MHDKDIKRFLTYHKRHSVRKVKVLNIHEDTVDIQDMCGESSGIKSTIKKSKFLEDFYR